MRWLVLAVALLSGCGARDYFVRADDYAKARKTGAPELPALRIADDRHVLVQTATLSPVAEPRRADGLLFVKAMERSRRRTGMLASGIAMTVAGAVLTAIGTGVLASRGAPPSCEPQQLLCGFSYDLDSTAGGLSLGFGLFHLVAGVALTAAGAARW